MNILIDLVSIYLWSIWVKVSTWKTIFIPLSYGFNPLVDPENRLKLMRIIGSNFNQKKQFVPQFGPFIFRWDDGLESIKTGWASLPDNLE